MDANTVFPSLFKPESPPMPARSRKIRFSAMPAMLFAVGLGLLFHYGHAWYRLPAYSAVEIAQSVELNLLLEQQGRHASNTMLSAEQTEARRGVIEQELRAEIQREQRDALLGVSTGVILLLTGLAQILILRRMAAR